MGNARARGNYEERKEQAQRAGRIQKRIVSSAAPISSDPIRGFLDWWRSRTWTPKPNKSFAKHRAERRAQRLAERIAKRKAEQAAA